MGNDTRARTSTIAGRVRARFGAAVALGVLAAATACFPQPGPSSPYDHRVLAPGNRIHLDVGGPGSADNLIVSNPGGVTSWSSDPAAAEDLRLDTLGLGDPSSDLRFGPITTPNFHFGLFDGAGELLIDLGPEFGSTLFSADGSTFAVSHMYGPDPDVVIYDTDTLTVRRTIPWDAATLGQPTVVDLSRDGSTILLRGTPPPPPFPNGPVADMPIYRASTSGTDTPVVVVPDTGEVKIEIRATTADRIAYVAEVVGPTTTWELRTVGLDGSEPRTLWSFPAFGIAPGLAAEIGTGRLVLEAPTAGSTTQSDLWVVEDSDAATRTMIAGGVEISSNLGGLTRLVTAP